MLSLARRFSCGKSWLGASVRSFASKTEKKHEQGPALKEQKPLSEKMIEHNAEKEAKKSSDIHRRKVGGKYVETHERIVKHPEDQNSG